MPPRYGALQLPDTAFISAKRVVPGPQNAGCTAFTLLKTALYVLSKSSSASPSPFSGFGMTSMQLVGRLVSPAAPSSCTSEHPYVYSRGCDTVTHRLLRYAARSSARHIPAQQANLHCDGITWMSNRPTQPSESSYQGSKIEVPTSLEGT